MFRCRHCEYLQSQLDRVRSDARSDLAIERAARVEEVNRVKALLDEALRRNDVLQLSVLQGIGSPAGSAYVNRVDRAAGAAPPNASDDWVPSTAEEMSEAPFAKIKRAEMLADQTQWIHKRKEEQNKAAVANPPGAFVVNPRPENDLVPAK